MNMRKMPQSEKPREKLLREGRDKLSNMEILAIIIGSGTRQKSAMELAAEIISKDSSGIRFLADCRPEELTSISGIGPCKATEILAAVELGKRLASIPATERDVIKSSSDIADIFMERMRYRKKEHLI